MQLTKDTDRFVQTGYPAHRTSKHALLARRMHDNTIT